MKTPTALIVSAMIVLAGLVWHAGKTYEAVRCGGFLASQSGGNAIEKLAMVKVARDDHRTIDEAGEVLVWRASLDAAGCRVIGLRPPSR